eukprot:TRINITY_DN33084_c0_g1_i1.p1 TRINITY_DN33084_c0_g1~~TRINITY_DN33084_c0_g1_i1.p1  ORF type:complete len:306 (-),score=45.45 TRINITY_DN33084_c0_g1_i1:126-1043(-)
MCIRDRSTGEIMSAAWCHWWTALTLLFAAASGGLVCATGWEAIYVLGTSGEEHWRLYPANTSTLPTDAFLAITECKSNGTHLLLTADNGGVGLVHLASRTVVFSAMQPGAHSGEFLPGGRVVVVATDTGPQAQNIALYDTRTGQNASALWSRAAVEPHGAVYGNGTLYVSQGAQGSGGAVLAEYALANWSSARPGLELMHSTSLAGLSSAHDLTSGPQGSLVLCTAKHVWRFDSLTRSTSPYPLTTLYALGNVKGVSFSGGLAAVVQGGWNELVMLVGQSGSSNFSTQPQCCYKARWLPQGGAGG